MKSNLYYIKNATHVLACKHYIGVRCMQYEMKCILIKITKNGYAKIAVFGDRNWKDKDHIVNIRYVKKDRLKSIEQKKEGWSIDITNKKSTHYYKDGISLCNKETQKFYMDKFDTSVEYTQILGSVCALCYKKLKNRQ